MLNLNQAGIATLAVGIAAIAVVGGTAGTSVAIDQMDTQPDSPLYALERAGEKLKSPFLGGQNWQIKRGNERTNEFIHMWKENKAQDYIPLLKEVGNHFTKAAKNAEDNLGLERAKSALEKHVNILENIKDRVPQSAKPAILLAKERSSRQIRVLENLGGKISPGMEMSGKIGKKLEDEIDEVNEEINEREENVENRIKNAKGDKETIDRIVEEVENKLREGKEKKKATGKEVSTSGIIRDVEFTTYMYGTHVLQDKDGSKTFYALKSEKVDLNDYLKDKVRIEGVLIHSGLDTGPPYVKVNEISLLEEGGSESSDNQKGENTPYEPGGGNPQEEWSHTGENTAKIRGE